MLNELALRLPTHSYLATISKVVTGEDVIIHEAQAKHLDVNNTYQKVICNFTQAFISIFV